MSAFVSPLATIAQALSLTSGGSTVLRKGTRRFWPHGHDRCRSLMLTCQNSPCWLSCECCTNDLSSLWSPLPAIDWAWLPRGMCVNWNELHLRYGESQPGLQRGYQECGCPFCYWWLKMNAKSNPSIFGTSVCWGEHRLSYTTRYRLILNLKQKHRHIYWGWTTISLSYSCTYVGLMHMFSESEFSRHAMDSYLLRSHRYRCAVTDTTWAEA